MQEHRQVFPRLQISPDSRRCAVTGYSPAEHWTHSTRLTTLPESAGLHTSTNVAVQLTDVKLIPFFILFTKSLSCTELF